MDREQGEQREQADRASAYAESVLNRLANRRFVSGIEGLIERWEFRVAGLIDDKRLGYTIEEYRNDLDGRRILSSALEVATAEELLQFAKRLETADAHFRELTFESDDCVWGLRVAARRGYTRAQHWWYYRWPRRTWRGFLISEKSTDT